MMIIVAILALLVINCKTQKKTIQNPNSAIPEDSTVMLDVIFGNRVIFIIDIVEDFHQMRISLSRLVYKTMTMIIPPKHILKSQLLLKSGLGFVSTWKLTATVDYRG